MENAISTITWPEQVSQSNNTGWPEKWVAFCGWGVGTWNRVRWFGQGERSLITQLIGQGN